jgi:DNA-directed RNA polymerase alpha subunit
LANTLGKIICQSLPKKKKKDKKSFSPYNLCRAKIKRQAVENVGFIVNRTKIFKITQETFGIKQVTEIETAVQFKNSYSS